MQSSDSLPIASSSSHESTTPVIDQHNLPAPTVDPLPCPWCGCETEVQGIRTTKTRLYVGCTNLFCLAYGPNASTDTKAIEAWNRVASLSLQKTDGASQNDTEDAANS